MLREKNLFRKMHRLYVCGLLEEGNRHIWIDCGIGRKVYSIVDLLDLNTVILAVIFLSYFLELNYSDICSFFNLLENAIIKSRSSF